MAKPQEQQVTQRRAIATLEDQNKYSMPDGRRLRVVADPVRMNVEAEVPASVQLAEALARVKPDLMNILIDEQSTENAQEVQQGILERTAGMPADQARSEWRQYGFEHQSAFLAGEDLGAKLEADIKGKSPDIPFDQWYQEWWATNGQGIPNKPETNITFNKSFTKSLVKARDFDTTNTLALTKEKQSMVATEHMFRAIADARRKNLPVTTAEWSALKNDVAKGFSNPETDELFYNALERYALENNDVDSLNVLYEPRGEVPALINNPKFTQKIVALRTQVLSKSVAERNALEKEKEDAIKLATDKFETDIRFKLMGIGNIENPVERSAQITKIFEEVKEARSKYNLSKGFQDVLESRMVRADKGEATEYQNQTFRTLYTSGASTSAIDKAVSEGDITQAQWNQLMAKKQQERDRAERLAQKGEKPIEKAEDYKQALKSIKIRAGYSPFNMQPDSKESALNAGLALERFKEVVEDKVDSGMSFKDAVTEARNDTFQFMTDTGLMNKEAVKAEQKIDKADKLSQLAKDPVGYYTRNLEDFANDSKQKTLYSGLKPEQKKYLQKKNEERLLELNKKAKTKPKDTKVN